MKINIKDKKISWDENKYPTILSMSNVIYLLTFPDNAIYIGETPRPFCLRLQEHCTKKENNLKSDFINQYKTFKIDILNVEKDDTLRRMMEGEYIKKAKECGAYVINSKL